MNSQNTAPVQRSEAGTDIRKQAPNALPAVLAGIGSFLVIFLLSELTSRLEISLLIAPFGASCVLVFGLPQSPLAQPRNVIGGHLISTAVGLLVFSILGATPLAFGIGVGLAIIAMLLTGTVHPPAGADPIVVILAGAGWSFLFLPVLVGAVTIVVAGLIFRAAALAKPESARARALPFMFRVRATDQRSMR